jgi:oxygen-independent coproporphyrinogen-3 oxidase
MYLLADELLSGAGYGWYEISNWARPGRASRHNMTYWLGGAWEAVGPGAHAFDGARTRRWNAARLDAYIAALSAGRLPPGGEEVADSATATADRAMLRLRTKFGAPLGDMAEAAWATASGLLELHGDRLRLTASGRLLSNEVFAALLSPSSDAK